MRFSTEIPCFIYFADILVSEWWKLQESCLQYAATSPNDFYLSTCDICTVLYRDPSFSQKPQAYLNLTSEEIPRWAIQALVFKLHILVFFETKYFFKEDVHVFQFKILISN